RHGGTPGTRSLRFPASCRAFRCGMRPGIEYGNEERPMPEWLKSLMPEGWSEWHIAAAATAFAIISAVVSLTVAAYVLGRLPADFFVNPECRSCRVRHPV